MTIEPDLGDFLGIIRHRWWVVAIAMIVGGVAAFVYASTRTPVYTATAEVLVRPTLTSPTRPIEPVTMGTEVRLAGSAAVARSAERTLDDLGLGTDIQALLGGVSVDSVEATEILEVSFTDTDPTAAQRSAQAFAESYLAFKSQQALDAVEAYAAPLRQQISNAEAALNAVNHRIGNVEQGSSRWEVQLDRRSALMASLLNLQDQLAPISTLSTDPGEVIRPAALPTSPSSPKLTLIVAAGTLLGLLFGVSLAYTWPGTGRPRGKSLGFEG